MEKDLREAALEYHRWPTPGKISVRPTKGLTNQRDLALAYSPGVAASSHCDCACLAIPAAPRRYRDARDRTRRERIVVILRGLPKVCDDIRIGKPGAEGPAHVAKFRAIGQVFLRRNNEGSGTASDRSRAERIDEASAGQFNIEHTPATGGI